MSNGENLSRSICESSKLNLCVCCQWAAGYSCTPTHLTGTSLQVTPTEIEWAARYKKPCNYLVLGFHLNEACVGWLCKLEELAKYIKSRCSIVCIFCNVMHSLGSIGDYRNHDNENMLIFGSSCGGSCAHRNVLSVSTDRPAHPPENYYTPDIRKYRKSLMWVMHVWARLHMQIPQRQTSEAVKSRISC